MGQCYFQNMLRPCQDRSWNLKRLLRTMRSNHRKLTVPKLPESKKNSWISKFSKPICGVIIYSATQFSKLRISWPVSVKNLKFAYSFKSLIKCLAIIVFKVSLSNHVPQKPTSEIFRVSATSYKDPLDTRFSKKTKKWTIVVLEILKLDLFILKLDFLATVSTLSTWKRTINSWKFFLWNLEGRDFRVHSFWELKFIGTIVCE